MNKLISLSLIALSISACSIGPSPEKAAAQEDLRKAQFDAAALNPLSVQQAGGSFNVIYVVEQDLAFVERQGRKAYRQNDVETAAAKASGCTASHMDQGLFRFVYGDISSINLAELDALTDNNENVSWKVTLKC